ncbi:hypothetical protein BaRGS_00001316, partial [Batillaria attramentaria]
RHQETQAFSPAQNRNVVSRKAIPKTDGEGLTVAKSCEQGKELVWRSLGRPSGNETSMYGTSDEATGHKSN